MIGAKSLWSAALVTVVLGGCCGNTRMYDEVNRELDDEQFPGTVIGAVDGRDVVRYTLKNANGMEVDLMSYGATVTRCMVPDRDGTMIDVVLGFDSLAEYQEKSPYFGCMAGRVGNRIAKGHFQLDGVEYHLATNNGPNHLHGGDKGFDKHNWESFGTRNSFKGRDGVMFKRISEAGEEGYPGRLRVSVLYWLDDDNTLGIEVQARTDAATPCNIVHHTYWNLGGHDSGTILEEKLTLHASRYTPTDGTLIPTGQIVSVTGTPFDFNLPKAIGSDIGDLPPTGDDPGGYDLNFVVDGDPASLREVARVHSPSTGITMEIMANQPGVQFYTGNWLDALRGKGGAVYPKYGGFCLETQQFPDAINHRGDVGWPDAVLREDETYRHTMQHRFTVE